MRNLINLIKDSKHKFKKSLIGLTAGAMLYASALGLENKINAEDVSARKIFTPNLIAYWSFDTDASESLGNSALNGTFVGNAHIENTGQAPILYNGGCLVLDGAPSRVNLPAPLAPILGELREGTIEAWGYLTSSNPEGAMIFNSGIPARYTDINLWIDKEINQTRIGFNNTSFQFPLRDFQFNKWHHYVWSWNESKMQFWMDNNLIGTQPNSRSVPFTGNESEIGSDDQEWGYWIGKIDEVKIWNKIFSPIPIPTPTPGPLSVISPRGGEVFDGHSLQPVHWKSNVHVAGTVVRLELWHRNYLMGDIGYGWNPNGETTNYVLIPLVPAETDYNIRAVSFWDQKYSANSGKFAVTGSAVRLESPNGGENWPIGSKQMVHWEANPDIAGTAVKFELWSNLMTQSSRNFQSKKISDLELSVDDKNYNLSGYGFDEDGEDVNTIRVPNVTPGNYKVRLVSVWDSKYWDESDNYLTISAR